LAPWMDLHAYFLGLLVRESMMGRYCTQAASGNAPHSVAMRSTFRVESINTVHTTPLLGYYVLSESMHSL
jgi:hypothetical protein